MQKTVARLPPREEIQRERCRRSFVHFADNHCKVLSETAGPAANWIPFKLWPAQVEVARALQENKLVVILKSRQLGLSWLALAFALWQTLFHPVATVLLFSRRDDEATDLLWRLKEMHKRLPAWLQAKCVEVDNDHEWQLAGGSRVVAFPCTAGDSYTASLVIVDEADLVPDLDKLMRAVKPTVDGGGRMLLVSRADKGKPESPFKRIFRAAVAGESEWRPIFLPWHARPDRDAAWREAQRRDILARTGSLDDLAEQYPETAEEALAPRSLDKRLPLEWLQKCYQPLPPLKLFRAADPAPPLPGLAVFVPPVPGRSYIVGGDPAQGNPTSNESAGCVLDADTGEEMAMLAGRFEPATFGSYLDTLGHWYNNAALMIESNNHGFAVLQWLREHSKLRRLQGQHNVDGWNTNTKSKSVLFDKTGEILRDGHAIMHGSTTFEQLACIEGSTLAAPSGQRDDRAMAFVLGLVGGAVFQRNKAQQQYFAPRVFRYGGYI